jgi:hypothetical protein
VFRAFTPLICGAQLKSFCAKANESPSSAKVTRMGVGIAPREKVASFYPRFPQLVQLSVHTSGQSPRLSYRGTLNPKSLIYSTGWTLKNH